MRLGRGLHLCGEPSYEYSKGISDGSGLPTYGINLDKDMLPGVLEDIGDNDAAKSAIGKATTLYNGARFEYAAAHHGDDPSALTKVSHSSSSFAGFMTDGLVNGNIDSEKEAAEERKKVAEFFTAPLDLIPTDKVPVIGDLIMGEVKDAITEGHTTSGFTDTVTAAGLDTLRAPRMATGTANRGTCRNRRPPNAVQRLTTACTSLTRIGVTPGGAVG